MLVPWAIFWKVEISKPVIEVNYTCFCVPKIDHYYCSLELCVDVFTSHHNYSLLHRAQGIPDLLKHWNLFAKQYSVNISRIELVAKSPYATEAFCPKFSFSMLSTFPPFLLYTFFPSRAVCQDSAGISNSAVCSCHWYPCCVLKRPDFEHLYCRWQQWAWREGCQQNHHLSPRICEIWLWVASCTGQLWFSSFR